MKRLFIISWITLLFISCGDDFLTKFPDDAVVTENAITTIAETQRLLTVSTHSWLLNTIMQPRSIFTEK